MVDALDAAWQVLHPRGVVIDARPAVDYQPLLAIRQRTGRHVVGPIAREQDPGVAAARRAVRRVVRDGHFDIVSRTTRKWSSRYADLADLRWLARVNDNWTIASALWRRAAAAWRSHSGVDPIEIGRVYSQTILRKRVLGTPRRPRRRRLYAMYRNRARERDR